MTRIPNGIIALAIAAAIALVALSASAGADKVPAAVAATLKAAYPDAVARYHDDEKEYGVHIYEMAVGTGATAIKVDVAADGTRIEAESMVKPDALPAPVAAAAKAAVGDGSIRRCVKIITYATVANGKVTPLPAPVTTYEVKWHDGSARHEQEYDASGKVITDRDDDGADGDENDDDDEDDDDDKKDDDHDDD